ncbi:MAG TPA: adenosylmethionine--8-amino-7-oxononanoate transaminase [Candidatus Margulisiibacteriota bacterium]|nr:adenosylmethionine--8-amino-7-oxononanoate transaminase [Candidatus Margulisiibacteriota bacterium]
MRLNPEELAAWDQASLWHPFTQMQEWLADEPLIIAGGDGNYLIDVFGNRYLDGVSSLWCNVHGHRHPVLTAALHQQADRIAHSTLLGLASVPSIVLARRLVQIAPPGLTRVFYSDAGATAVEIALKMAFQYWQLRGEARRTQFVALTEAYHGDTIGAVSAGYSEAFHRFFKPLLFPCHKLNPPHVFRWQRGMEPEAALQAAVAEAAALFADKGPEVAALIVEPLMQGAAGMWAHPAAYLRALRDLTRQHGALLICDEVATGFGRTGKMFAVEHAAVAPDLLCLGKGISGGYLPLAATLATEEIFCAFLGRYEEYKTFFHGHTYTGNALACAVALANLDVFEGEQVLARVQDRSRQLTERLATLASLPHVGDVRQWGLMVGIELVAQRDDRRSYPPARRMGMQVTLEGRQHGVILRPLGDVIILMPPLSITEDQLDFLCRVTRDAILRVTNPPEPS